jgi:hypothetical protein
VGNLIAVNDDSDFFQTGLGFNAGTDPGSDPFADHDPFIGELVLAAGTYYVAVSHWANDANGSRQAGISFSPLSHSGSGVTGATPDSSFELAAACADPILEQCVGAYQLQVRTDFTGVVDSEGASTSGLNDTALSAQSLGTLPPEQNGALTTIGWIDVNNVNDVDFWQFSVPEAAGVHFDIDFAEDVRTGGDFDQGLDPELWIFDSSGRVIANNDDADFFEIGGFNAGTDPGSDPFGDHDPFIGELLLDPGVYTVAVAYWANNANAISQGGLSFTSLSESGDSISGATPDATFALDRACDDPVFEQCVGAYQLQVRTFFEPMPFIDTDGDDIPDGIDNCPEDSNTDQADADNNDTGDACNDFEDSDGDDWADGLDNCPNSFDASQSDQDGDGLGDVCDPFPHDPDHDLAQCSSDLGDCQINLLSCESDAAQCSVDLSLAQASLTICNGDLSSCIATATQLEADLIQTQGDLAQTQASLSQAQADITLLQADVTQLQSDLAFTEAGLQQTEADLTQTQADLAVATADMDGDGIRDTADACPGTTAHAEVDLVGCSRAQFCAAVDVSTGPARATCNNSDWQNDEPRAENPEDCKAQQGVCVPLG